MSLPQNAHEFVASKAKSLCIRPHVSTDLIDKTTEECIPLLKNEFGNIRDYDLEIFSSAKKAVKDLISTGIVTVILLEAPAGNLEHKSARSRRLLMPKGWQVH